MNQIQTYTLTTISRIGGTFPLPRGKGQEMTAEAVAALAAEAEAKSAVVPGVVKLPAAVSSGRRRRAVADDDDESDGSDEVGICLWVLSSFLFLLPGFSQCESESMLSLLGCTYIQNLRPCKCQCTSLLILEI